MKVSQNVLSQHRGATRNKKQSESRGRENFQKERARKASGFFDGQVSPLNKKASAMLAFCYQKLALRGVLGNGITSRTFCTPVT